MMTIFLDYWVALKRAFWVDGIEAPVALRLGRTLSVLAGRGGILVEVWHWRGHRGPTFALLCLQAAEEERIGRGGPIHKDPT